MAELQRRMSSREFTEWMAYEKVAGPMGAERDDAQFAVLGHLMYTLWADTKKHRMKPADFLIEWDRRDQTPEDMLAKIRVFNALAGGKEE